MIAGLAGLIWQGEVKGHFDISPFKLMYDQLVSKLWPIYTTKRYRAISAFVKINKIKIKKCVERDTKI